MTRVLTRTSSKTFEAFDRSWLFEVCSGVLRYRGRLDYMIDTYALKKKPAGELRRLLQIAVFQLLAQDVEAALVVSETVHVIRTAESQAPSQFANAILRKIAGARQEWRDWKVTESSPFLEQLAWSSLPEWLFKKLRKERGSPWVFAFAEAILKRPQIWYRTRKETLLLEKGFRGDEPEGFVQDISNQKLVEEVVHFLKDRFQSKPKILDLCSAPGGKALALAYAGFSVIATDHNQERMQRVIENRSRLKLENEIEIRDYDKVIDGEERYDVIWIDAPCSSTGIVRRHPEIKWNRTFSDVERVALAQQVLQEWASRHLTPNGVVIYSTCSLLSLENQACLRLNVMKTLEWNPAREPFGDGIFAMYLVAKNAL